MDKTVGDDFLNWNDSLTSFIAPNLKEVGDYFLYYNKSLTSFIAPKLTTVVIGFLSSNHNNLNKAENGKKQIIYTREGINN